MTDGFQMVGIRPVPPSESGRSAPWYRGKPVAAAVVLAVIVLGCLCSEILMTKDPTYLDLTNCNVAPNREFLFGTDAMGRDLFSMIWYGGRVSLLIGILATAISTVLAIVFGAASGMAYRKSYNPSSGLSEKTGRHRRISIPAIGSERQNRRSANPGLHRTPRSSD